MDALRKSLDSISGEEEAGADELVRNADGACDSGRTAWH